MISPDKLLSLEDVQGRWSFSGYPGHDTCLPVTGLLVESYTSPRERQQRWVGLRKITRRYLMSNKIPCGSPPRVRPTCHRLYPVSPIYILWRFDFAPWGCPALTPSVNSSISNPTYQVWLCIWWNEDHGSVWRLVLYSENSRKIYEKCLYGRI